jgi:hypothetical protein
MTGKSRVCRQDRRSLVGLEGKHRVCEGAVNVGKEWG